MNEILRYILLCIASLLGILIICIYMINNKNSKYIQALEKNEYFMQVFFIIGLNILDYVSINNNYILTRCKEKIEFLKGEKYLTFYYKIISAAMITYLIIFIEVGLILATIFNEMKLFLLLFVLALFCIIYIFLEIELKYKKQIDALLSDFPKMLSKLQVFLTTGMSLREAWKKVGLTGEERIFVEMQKIDVHIQNGYTEIEAINKFGDDCKINEIKKFSLLLSQNIEKGNRDIILMINALANESWENERHRVIKKAEIASSKLVFPLVIMLISIMLMVVVPIFSEF